MFLKDKVSVKVVDYIKNISINFLHVSNSYVTCNIYINQLPMKLLYRGHRGLVLTFKGDKTFKIYKDLSGKEFIKVKGILFLENDLSGEVNFDIFFEDLSEIEDI